MERLKILITGGTGFIGSNLASFFDSKGHDVAITLREESSLWRISGIKENLTMFLTDIIDAYKVKEIFNSYRPDVVIHTAAFGGYHFETKNRHMFDVNLIATINLVEAFLESNSGLLINTGSSSEYGFKSMPMKESDVLEPYGSYAVSKAAATMYCRSRSLETNRNIVTYRLFSAYGYYEEPHRLIPYVLSSILRGKRAKLNNPDNVRDFIFADDISNAYEKLIKAMDKVNKGEIFNLGSGKETSVKRIIEIAEKVSGKQLNVDWVFNNERIGDRAKHWVADTLKTEGAFNWRPKHSIEEGLLKTYSWLGENISKYEMMENSKARKYCK